MKTLQITIFKVVNSLGDSVGRKVLNPFERRRVINQCWQEYLHDTGQDERLDRLYAMSSRKRSPRVNRIRRSRDFAIWSDKHSYDEWCEPFMTAECDYDGRLSESEVRAALFEAAVDGHEVVLVHPKSNRTKPAHERLVYVTYARLNYI